MFFENHYRSLNKVINKLTIAMRETLSVNKLWKLSKNTKVNELNRGTWADKGHLQQLECWGKHYIDKEKHLILKLCELKFQEERCGLKFSIYSFMALKKIKKTNKQRKPRNVKHQIETSRKSGFGGMRLCRKEGNQKLIICHIFFRIHTFLKYPGL